jgi:hypothetical protein
MMKMIIPQRLAVFIEKNFKSILFLLILWFLAKESYGKALEFYFWRDDWALLWTANFNPADFFGSTVGPNWQIRTGVLWYPYIIYLHKFIQNTFVWQYFGLILKFLNSLILYFFIFSLTKNKMTSVITALLYASYSGGIESYSWHRITALATTFALLGMTFYVKYIDSFETLLTKNQYNFLKSKYFWLSILFIIFSFLSYFGRAIGIIPLICLFNFMLFIDSKTSRFAKKWLVLFTISLVSVFTLVLVFAGHAQSLPNGYLLESIQNGNLFFGITGNLLRNPYWKIPELGGLAGLSFASYFFGWSIFVLGLISGIMYIKRKRKNLFLITFFASWIYLFYITNWLFGGGGIYTIVGSGHRYFALAAVGWMALTGIVISLFSKKLAIIITVIVIVMNLKYSTMIIAADSSVRNASLITPIHQEILSKTEKDADVRVLVIYTPNKLNSFVVLGWFPYTFAYYRGFTDFTKFPTVFSGWEDAKLWLCTKDQTIRDTIEKRDGVIDYQKGKTVDLDHVYAWKLEEDGSIYDKTDLLKLELSVNCKNGSIVTQ